MEPNILATPTDALAAPHDWQSLSDAAVQSLPLEPGRATPDFGARVNTPIPAPGTHATTLTAHHARAHGHDIVVRNGWTAAAVSLAPPAAAAMPVHLAGHPAVAPAEARGLYLRFGKRALDVAGALLGLAIGLPILGILAVLIKLDSRGPVLYRSKRVGLGGRPFTFYKLRSMVPGADRHRHRLSHLNETDGPVFKMSRDPRVTKIGRLLRTTSLDELPQLFNVLKGEMTLVGPRPPIPEEVAQYEPWQLRRLTVKPGLTCLWQISGRSRLGFQEWMRLDLEYIRHQSAALDLKILIRTLPAVLSREGAY